MRSHAPGEIDASQESKNPPLLKVGIRRPEWIYDSTSIPLRCQESLRAFLKEGTMYRVTSSLTPCLLSFFFAILFLVCSFPAWAAQVTLAWDANDPAPDGYHVFLRETGQSYDYNNPAWSGGETTCTLTDLTDNSQYYFVVRAYVGNDESGDSNEVEHLTPGSNNQEPIADAGNNQTVASQSTVTLDGSGSADPNGDSLTYSWIQSDGPSVLLLNTDTAQAMFTAPQASSSTTILTFQITVTDPSGLSSTDSCTVTIAAVLPTNEPPEAEAGPNQAVTSGAAVQLDGSGSTDPEGSLLNYYWTQNGGPAVLLSASNAMRPTLTAPIVNSGETATLIFELTVTDDHSATSADTCIIFVQPAEPTDSDGDGVIDDLDAFPHDPTESVDTDGDGTGNTADTDDDNDGMPDEWEQLHGLNPLVDDSNLDADQDGINNIDEYIDGSAPNEPDQNQPPMQPEIRYPLDGDIDVETALRLTASEFIDPDTDDNHTQSEWVVFTEHQEQTVLQVIVDKGKLTSYRLPRLTLNPSTSYLCQVRYYDDLGQMSDWSLPVQFTTRAGKNDDNKNGVSDNQDVTEETDLNLNGLSDLDETQSTRSLMALDGEHMIAVDVKDNTPSVSIDSASVIDPNDLNETPEWDDVYTYGLFTFRIQVQEPGQKTLTTIYLSDTVEPGTRWTSLTVDGDWTDCTSDITKNDDGYSIRRSITDGGAYDVDGVANGTIITKIGPVLADGDQDRIDAGLEDSDPITNPDVPGSSSCFIGSLIN